MGMHAVCEVPQWKVRTTVREFAGDVDLYRRLYGREEGERRFFEEHPALAERSVEGNLLLREGILALFTLLTGGAETAFSEANARIGVGDDGTTPAADTQTDLQAVTNKTYKAQDTSYPVLGALADKKVTFRSTFGTGDANYAWAEWVVDNGAAAGKTLNRKVAALGTKTSASSWQLTVEISLA